MPDPATIAAELKRKALEMGFILAGITSAEPSKYREHLRRWLDDGQAGTMNYLAARFEERTDPSVYFPGVKSILCVAMNYYSSLADVPTEQRTHHARVARYALGDDYHEVIKARLHTIADWLRKTVPGTLTRVGVDTAPILERELAARAGIGWIGKNTCIIHPKIGSWVFLAEILTTLELPVDAPITDYCGTCRRCIDACPTDALQPYKLDARRCISYLNIEHRGDIAAEFHDKLGDWLYGCDICQDVCPFNRKPPETDVEELKPRTATGTLDLREVLSWREGETIPARRHNAMKRVKLPILQRNARLLLSHGRPAHG